MTTSVYPSQIDTAIPIAIDNSTPVEAAVVNRLRDAILAVEQAVGTNPGSIYGSVSGRLSVLEAGQSTANAISIQEYFISPAAPSSGQALIWSGSEWGPTTIPLGFIAGGDLSGVF